LPITSPTSKLDSLRMLDEAGVSPPSYRTVKRRLPVFAHRAWRQRLAAGCAAHAGLGPASLVLYDVSTLSFETDTGDGFRLVARQLGRVLMVRPTYKDGWDIPGGYVEPDESPAHAAEREPAEELGLHRKPGRLLVIDWAPHPAEGDKLLFIFDGGTLTQAEGASLRPDGREIDEAG
jgi:NUDIX domain